MPNYGLTHHKLQQKLFLRVYYQKGNQNNIIIIKNVEKSRRANIVFSAWSNMATKHPNFAISLFLIAINQWF